jgi:predicted CoA-binding protein
MDETRAVGRFLACKRLALVGVSRDAKHFSRGVLRAFVERGYDVVPLNPSATEIEGRPCHRSVRDVTPPVEAALLLTPAARSAAAVEDCLAAGVRRIWFHRGGGPGAASVEALALCDRSGVDVVPGACPLMFLPRTGVVHRVHGFFHRLHQRRRPAA